MTTALWFTDAHVTPSEDLSRFSILGQHIINTQPQYIIQGGDFGTFDTFSRWDRDKRLKIEGQRYKKDIDACNKAIDLMVSPLEEYNKTRREQHKKQYTPSWIWFEGNHEDWANQYVIRNPELEGIINVRNDLDLHRFDDLVWVPYSSDVWYHALEGVFFCHIPRTRVGPASNKYIADKALELFDGSVVFGHTHRLVSSTVSRTGQANVHQALSGGCFFEHTPHYAVGHNNDYWSGVIHLILHGNGRFTFWPIFLEDLRKEFKNDR